MPTQRVFGQVVDSRSHASAAGHRMGGGRTTLGECGPASGAQQSHLQPVKSVVLSHGGLEQTGSKVAGAPTRRAGPTDPRMQAHIMLGWRRGGSSLGGQTVCADRWKPTVRSESSALRRSMSGVGWRCCPPHWHYPAPMSISRCLVRSSFVLLSCFSLEPALGGMSGDTQPGPGGVSRLVHLQGVLGDSERFTCALKVWRQPADGTCRWELRRLLPAVGYTETRSTHLCRHLRSEWLVWEALVRQFDMQVCACMGKSRRALASSSSVADSALEDAEQEFWASTQFM